MRNSVASGSKSAGAKSKQVFGSVNDEYPGETATGTDCGASLRLARGEVVSGPLVEPVEGREVAAGVGPASPVPNANVHDVIRRAGSTWLRTHDGTSKPLQDIRHQFQQERFNYAQPSTP